MKKIIFLTWARYHRRPEIFAQYFNSKSVFIYCGNNWYLNILPFRYILQAWKTWHILVEEQPDIVFCQNPPIFCALIAYFYARIFKVKYVIDSHTGAFLSPKWRWSAGLHRILSKSALLTIVHNSSQEKIIEKWKTQYLVIGYTPGNYPPGKDFPIDDKFNVAFVCSYHKDEPIGLVFDAARSFSDVNFYFTGDYSKIQKSFFSKKPDNCHLTGYLSYDLYVGLLRKVDAIMILTTGNQTLLMGAFEAVSLRKPMIVSDTPVLRDYFTLGTVHVLNTTDDIIKGVHFAKSNLTILKTQMDLLANQLQSEWTIKLIELQRIINE